MAQRLDGGPKALRDDPRCSDSRVPVELVFDQGFGDLFVIRIAGNLTGTNTLASVEYSVLHLDVRLVVVMGHEQCGSVTAALGSPEDRSREPSEVQEVLEHILRNVRRSDLPDNPAQRVSAGVEANVRSTVDQLREKAAILKTVGPEKLKIVGAVYELSTGRVRFLEDSPGSAKED